MIYVSAFESLEIIGMALVALMFFAPSILLCIWIYETYIKGTWIDPVFKFLFEFVEWLIQWALVILMTLMVILIPVLISWFMFGKSAMESVFFPMFFVALYFVWKSADKHCE